MTPRKVDLFDDKGALRSFEEIEHDVTYFALRHCAGSMTTTAKALRIGRSTLYRKLGETYRVIARARL